MYSCLRREVIRRFEIAYLRTRAGVGRGSRSGDVGQEADNSLFSSTSRERD